MLMKLELLYKNGNKETHIVKKCWQDYRHGWNQLYMETTLDDDGKGRFIKTDDLNCWQLTGYEIKGGNLEL